MEIFKHEGIDRVNLDGQMLTVYEYRPVPSMPHKLVVKYGNLFFTVGKSAEKANGVDNVGHSRSGSTSSTVEDLTQQLQAAQLRIDALSQNSSQMSTEKLAEIKAMVHQSIEMERVEMNTRLSRLEDILMQSLSTLQSTPHVAKSPSSAAIVGANPSHPGASSSPPPIPSRSPPPAQTSAPPAQSSPSGAQSSPSNDWYIAPEQRLVYESIFDQTDTERKGALSGAQVRDVLSRSKLPNQVLAQIWHLASLNKEAHLNKAEFCIAMFATTKAVHGSPLPNVAPPSLVASAGYMPQEEIYEEDDVVDETSERKVKKKKKRSPKMDRSSSK